MLPLWLNFLKPSVQLIVTDKAHARQHWLGLASRTWSVNVDASLHGIQKLNATVEQLLVSRPTQKKSRVAPACLSIIVPDEVARFELLPWVPNLMQQDELRQFAIERFELHNQAVRNGWEVQAEWRTNAASTLAYALPHELIQHLGDIAKNNGYQLNRVIPISAMAHYGQLGLPRASQLRLIHSGTCISALLYIKGKLQLHLMETVRGANEESVQRLLTRVQMSVAMADLTLPHIAVYGIDPDLIQRILTDEPKTTLRLINPLRHQDWL